MTNTELLRKHGLKVIAAAHEVLKASSEGGLSVEGVVMLIALARIVEADMRALFAGGKQPAEVLMVALDMEIRREIERIYTEGWARN